MKNSLLSKLFTRSSYHLISSSSSSPLPFQSEESTNYCDRETPEQGSRKRNSVELKSRILLALSCLVFGGIIVDKIVRDRALSTCQNVSGLDLYTSGNAQWKKDPVGQIPEVTEIFQAHEEYMKPFSGSEDIWNSILPPGRGFVFVPDSEKYGLKEGQQTEWGQIFSVSLFHQLHCLGLLRKQYWTLMDAVLEEDPDAAHELAVKQHGSMHTGHCFDYLRQGIMCAGDMSMEWPRDEPNGGKRIHVDGWGIPHKCKSWDFISQYMLRDGYNASKYNDIAVDGKDLHG